MNYLIKNMFILIRKIQNYWKNSPVSSKDIVLWCCLFISLIPAVYSFSLLSFYNVLQLLLKVFIVFLVVFLLIECYDHPTRTWNFNHLRAEGPRSIKALRCLVAVPIYNGTPPLDYCWRSQQADIYTLRPIIYLKYLMNKKETLTGNSNALREYKKTITLNPMQRQVLVGTLLGDASIPLRRGRSTLRVEFQQTIARAEYIWHLYEIFENFVGAPPRVRNIRGGGAQDRQSLRFHTYGHPEFKFYDEIFYTIDDPEGPGCSRKKRVPESINERLTAIALAYWFMDDGSHTSGKNRTYRFSTQSFPLSDQERLPQALINNFGIHATIQKHYSYYMLYIRYSSASI